MTTPEAVSSKFQLKWLHEEIDLYDRKLAHLDKYVQDTPAKDRARIASKRSTLEKTARRMAAEGIEFDPKELPRSFRPADDMLTGDLPVNVEPQHVEHAFEA